MPSIKFRNQRGNIQELNIDEIIEIDGRPYQDPNQKQAEDKQTREYIANIEGVVYELRGRVERLENWLMGMVSSVPEESESKSPAEQPFR